MWSYLLSSIGILGLLIAARQPRIGWSINLAAQALWTVYALSTGQHGFLLAAAAYTVAYGRLLRRAHTTAPRPAQTVLGTQKRPHPGRKAEGGGVSLRPAAGVARPREWVVREQ